MKSSYMPKYPGEAEGKKFLQQRHACRVEKIPAARPRISQDQRRSTIKGVCSVSENPARFSLTGPFHDTILEFSSVCQRYVLAARNSFRGAFVHKASRAPAALV